jgi:hypothetical protein
MHTDNRTASPANAVKDQPNDSIPTPRDLKPAIELMERLGYTSRAIAESVTAMGMFGTAQCVQSIDDEDRDAIEALLPRSAFWDSNCWDKEVWMTN